MSGQSNQPDENARRRIVIPLNRNKRKFDTSGTVSYGTAGSPRRRRVARVLAILGIIVGGIVLLAAAGIFLWWHHYKTTPAYSLALLIDAAQRNDMTTVDNIVDTDQIVKNFSAEVSDKAASRYGLALGAGAREQIESLTPKLLPTIRQSVRDALTARVREISQQADHKPFILVALGVPYLVNIAVTGDTAKASAVVQNQQVELEMLRAGSGWKIVRFRDEALVQRAIDQVIKDLPAVGRESQSPDTGKRLKGLPRIRK